MNIVDFPQSHFLVIAYTWYISLSYTTLSANTAIYNSSPALVYFFSIFILNDSITISFNCKTFIYFCKAEINESNLCLRFTDQSDGITASNKDE